LVTFTTPLASVMFPKVVQSVAGRGPTDAARNALAATALLGCVAALACTLLPALPLRIIYFRNSDFWQAAPMVPWFAWALLPLILANVLVTNLLARDRFQVVPWAVAVAIGYGAALLAQTNSLSRFSAVDVTNAPALAQSIHEQSNPLAQFIWNQLTPGQRRQLAEPPSAQRQLQETLAGVLNQLALPTPLYDPDRFAHMNLSARARELLKENPRGKELAHLNRLLLHEAYAPYLVPNRVKLFQGFQRVLKTLGLFSLLLLLAALCSSYRMDDTRRTTKYKLCMAKITNAGRRCIRSV
jgi:hypothetical protein